MYIVLFILKQRRETWCLGEYYSLYSAIKVARNFHQCAGSQTVVMGPDGNYLWESNFDE